MLSLLCRALTYAFLFCLCDCVLGDCVLGRHAIWPPLNRVSLALNNPVWISVIRIHQNSRGKSCVFHWLNDQHQLKLDRCNKKSRERRSFFLWTSNVSVALFRLATAVRSGPHHHTRRSWYVFIHPYPCVRLVLGLHELHYFELQPGMVDCTAFACFFVLGLRQRVVTSNLPTFFSLMHTFLHRLRPSEPPKKWQLEPIWIWQ